MPTFGPGLCGWLIVAFDASSQISEEVIRTEYDGVTLHIKPSPPENEFGDLASVFLEDPNQADEYLLKVNRFLSALSWRDRRGYPTLGYMTAASSSGQRDAPMFNYGAPRERSRVIYGPLDFEHLVCPRREEQRLALALYRDALCCNNVFYQFLNFSKIINIRHARGPGQVAWINAALARVGWRVHSSKSRLDALQSAGTDVGDYLYAQGRCAIAHAGFTTGEPIRDPDRPADRMAIMQDLDLMQELAEILIEDDLGVESVSTTWRRHLYELAGFKKLLGDGVVARLAARENVPTKEFPILPALSLGLKRKLPYGALQNLRFSVKECVAGVVLVVAPAEPLQVALVLDFPSETATLALESFAFDRDHESYSKEVEISFWQFLIDYFKNGFLEVREGASGERLSYKTAFLPVNIDGRATLANFQSRIDELSPSTPEGGAGG